MSDYNYSSGFGYPSGYTSGSGSSFTGHQTGYTSNFSSYPAAGYAGAGANLTQAYSGYPPNSHPYQGFPLTGRTEFGYPATGYATSVQSDSMHRSMYRQRDYDGNTSPFRATQRRTSQSPVRTGGRSGSQVDLSRARQRVYYYGTNAKTRVPEAFDLVRDHEIRQLELGATPRAASQKYHKILGIDRTSLTSSSTARSRSHSTSRVTTVPNVYTKLSDYDPEFLKKFEPTEDEKHYAYRVDKARTHHYGSRAESAAPEAYARVRTYEDEQRRRGLRY